MQVVGIDLGTTNLRISTWDSDQPNTIPQPLTIGRGDTYAMPTVVAFRRQPGGDIETIVGEDADNLEDSPNQVVVRNLKRYALAHDPYVRWHLEAREIEWEPWWNQDSRCVQVWGQDYPVKDLISLMLKEAFQRAGLSLGFEWRAGCPVHAGFTYRSELAEVITELGGTGQGGISKVIEEPLLLLALADQLKKQDPDYPYMDPGSSYLVYDLGGGSFDCALAQIKEADDGTKQMIIFGADGNPAIGGSDIDTILVKDLDYDGPPSYLRVAKERVRPEAEQGLTEGKLLTWEQYSAAVEKGGFATKTFTAMRDSYVAAKVIWGREEDAPPVGEIIQEKANTGEVEFIWQLGWENLAKDVDGIILCGGPTTPLNPATPDISGTPDPTTIPSILQKNLEARFGGETRIIPTRELFPEKEVRLPYPELTAISAGACCASTGKYIPMYVNRLPVRITLEDLQTGEKVEYEPYEHFINSPRRPFDAFVSQDFLKEQPDDPHSDARYVLTIATPDDVIIPIIRSDGTELEHQPVDPYINTRLVGSTLRLVINRLGQVAVSQNSEFSAPMTAVVIEQTPWQTNEQAKQLVARKLEEQQEYLKNQPVRGRLIGYVVNTKTGLVERGIYENQ